MKDFTARDDETDRDLGEGTRSMRRLFGVLRPFTPQLVLATLGMLLVNLSTMLVPIMMGDIINSAINPDSARNIDSIALTVVGLLILLAGLRFLAIYGFSRVSAKMLHAMRQRVLQHLLTLSADFFQKRHVGELSARVFANLEEIQNIITTDVLRGAQAFVRVVGIIVILSTINLKLTLTAVLGSVPFVAVSLIYGGFLERGYLRKTDALAECSAATEEVLSGIGTVQAFSQERKELSRYETLLNRLLGRQLDYARYSGSYIALADFFALAALVVVIWIGGRLIALGDLTAGELTACMMYMLVLAFSIDDVGRLFKSAKELNGISHRFFEILDAKPLVENRGKMRPDSLVPITLSFENVTFAYPSNCAEKVIDSLSLDISPGEVVALVGASGSGKSTLLKLLMRFYDADNGIVRVGGQPVSNYELGALRSLFGFMSQDIFLFSGTILDNIRYGNDSATPEEVAAALEAVGAADFVAGFQRGLHEQVGVGGSRLSGGERQRLGLARMYLKNPAVLLMDEPTSALDSESEAKVQLGLQKLKWGRTTIVIAHRLSTVREADRIVVIEKGTVLIEGSHAHLRENSVLYRRYWDWQSGNSAALPCGETG